VHITQAVEHLCDWDASVAFYRVNGEPTVAISALVGGYEYRSTGAKLEPVVESLIKSIEKQVKAKYTRPITKGKRSQ
jgi:hypothetical protein